MMSGVSADSGTAGDYYCPACERAFADAGACPRDGARLIRIGGGVDPFLGRELDGKYAILEKLGQGGMGAVYRAEQRGLGREVAIKVVSAHRSADPESIKRFLREARLASRMGHPNAVGVIDFGQAEDGVCYLVMELVAGRTLDQVLADEGPLAPARLVRIGAQICDALECAHALQIVHRDLKPANAMLLEGGRDFVKILDFGLAKWVGDAATSVTVTGTLIGTPAYMSPEVATGRPCDGRADLYSLGVMLFLLGTGQLPFLTESPHEMIALHGSAPAPAMTGVPRALGRVVDRLLRKEPDERYPTAAAVRDALEQAREVIERGDGAGAAIVDDEDGSAGRAAADGGAGAAAAERAGGVGAVELAGGEAGQDRAPRRPRRWVIPAAFAAVAAGAVVGYLARAGKSEQQASARPAAVERGDATGAVTPAGAATGAAPTDTATAGAAPAGTAATGAAATDTAATPAPATPAPATSSTARPTRPSRPPRASSRPARPADRSGQRPRDRPPPPPAGSGSARRDDLPF